MAESMGLDPTPASIEERKAETAAERVDKNVLLGELQAKVTELSTLNEGQARCISHLETEIMRVIAEMRVKQLLEMNEAKQVVEAFVARIDKAMKELYEKNAELTNRLEVAERITEDIENKKPQKIAAQNSTIYVATRDGNVEERHSGQRR